MGSWFNNMMRRRQYQRDEDHDQESPQPDRIVVEEPYPTEYSKFPTKPIIGFRELFTLNKWQGIGWLHFLYLLGTWFNLLFGSILTIYGLSSGRAGVALFSLIIGPLFFIISTIVLRVLVEVLLSVLMVPHLLHTTTAQPTPPTFNMTPLPTMAAAPPLNTTNPFSTEASPPEEVDRMAV